MNITNKGLGSNKELGTGASGIHSRCVGTDSVRGQRFVASVNVVGWEWRLVVLGQSGAHWDPCKLSGGLEGLLDHINWQPSKVGTQLLIVGFLGFDSALMDGVECVNGVN